MICADSWGGLQDSSDNVIKRQRHVLTRMHASLLCAECHRWLEDVSKIASSTTPWTPPCVATSHHTHRIRVGDLLCCAWHRRTGVTHVSSSLRIACIWKGPYSHPYSCTQSTHTLQNITHITHYFSDNALIHAITHFLCILYTSFAHYTHQFLPSK